MNLSKKKSLASRIFKVGRGRIAFIDGRREEIKEAITKQDIRDLRKEGAITIKNIKGRRKKLKKNKKRSPGNIRKKVNSRKKDYVVLTRKLRAYLFNLKKSGRVSREDFLDIRKKIRNKAFKSLSQLKDYVEGLKK